MNRPQIKLVATVLVLALVGSGMTASHRQQPAGLAAPDGTEPVPVSCGSGSLGVVSATGSVSLAAHQVVVSPTDAAVRTVAYDGAKLVVPPGAVRLPVGVGITPLSRGQVPRLDPGMDNVTAGPRAGYRFTPHPMQFAETIEVTLPYDPALIGPDFTAQDVYTYFYDEAAACWQALYRVKVDEVEHTVTSLTDHFTDMVNATVAPPEHPEGARFNPNQIEGIEAADPGSKINVISVPGGNASGDNRLSYPVELPPGRNGMQPELAVGYGSMGGNGWLGLGWDLDVPMLMVDTRWGVPRYRPDLETETYLLNGQQLTPVAHRGAPQPRTAEKVFHTRVEGGFARIVRHGSGPASYTWEVTDKAGTRSFYGALPGAAGPAADATLADGSGNVYLWALREVRDRHGNFIRYHYAAVADPGVADGTEPGRNLYPKRITYTGSGQTEGRYAVTFVRDRELNEPLRVDRTIDARGGFKRVTADLLRRVEVTLDSTLVRRYEFGYTTGAFHKTLLRSISQLDDRGAFFNKHEFDYFDDIRDGQGQYQAFEPAQWTVPGDGLTKGVLNLTPEQAGNASALNASTSTGAGGHLYVGAGALPGKSGSVGVKTGFSRDSHEGVLALVDVDADGLPDKVFRSGGSVLYRKNLSGPAGQLRFADQAQPLNLPGFFGETTNTVTLGVESYLGGVAAQLDFVNAFTTTAQYFTDVNSDGISDLVSGSTVLFGRLGADGVPVYGISSDTPVPITAGQLDPAGLFDSLPADRERLVDSFPLLDSVRRWVAPFAGTVRIEGGVRLADETAAARAASRAADGVRVAIQREDTELWWDTIGARDDTEHMPTNVGSVAVSRGDRLYFRVQSGLDGSLDQVSWDPRVSYLNVPDPLDVNGLPAHRYQASRDFTLGGRAAALTAPLTGTMHLSGTFTKKAATTDDVTVLITRDGTPVLEQTLAAASAGTVPVDLDVAVTQGQTLAWRARIDSPIDLDQIEWAPRASYTAAQGVDRVVDDSGQPLIDVFPPYDVDMYPVDELTAPQGFHHVTTTGTVTVNPALLIDSSTDEQPTGRLAFTVKRHGQLLAKRFFELADGAVTGPGPFAVPVNAGDDLFFDFSTTDSHLRELILGHAATVNGVTVPTALHSPAVEGAFPQPYRGWGAIGYNGNRDRAAQPIVQADLVVDQTFADQLPASVDPQAQKDEFAADPRIDPPKAVPFTPSPQRNRWGAGEGSWVARSAASSSRLGAESVDLPSPADLAGATAVPRLSRSQQISVTGSVGIPVGTVGGSVATGDSTGQVDYLDLNGDQFPDVVGAGAVQYTDPTGGLGATRGTLPDGAVRRSGNLSGNASAGSAARTIPTGRGHASPPGGMTASPAEAGNDMPPLGIGGNLGGSGSDGEFDLLDVNGDALPDRVYADGRVALNLGYRFGAAEQWRNPAPLNDGSGLNAGLNIGFNTDFYGFAGGASFNQGRSASSATLADMNGDGLLDRVFAGTPISVGFNTGNGFEPPVPFRGSLPEVNLDRNASLGGGAYVTFSICFGVVVACVIINPGGDVSTGASRTEQALRDINGDGYADHLLSTRDNQLVVVQNRTARTNLLRGVTRPLGARMEFDYQRDGNTFGQPQSRWVLSRVSVDDGRPGDGQDVQLTTFEYAGGRYDRLEREFFGYTTVVERHRDPGNADAVYRSVTRDYRTDSYYTKGLLHRELTSDAAGRPFLEEEHTYVGRDTAATAPADLTSTTATIFPQLVRTDRRFYEGQTTAQKTTFTTMEYDELGNVVRSFDAADVGVDDDVDVRTGYTATDPACRDTHIVGVPNTIDVFGGGPLLRHRESTVDCTNGNVTQVRAMLADGQTAVTDMEYFASGNLKAVTEPANKTGQRFRVAYTYDSTVDTYVESTTDSFGYVSRAAHNFKFGEVESTTDINNQVIRNSYDSVGRLDTVVGPYEAPEGRVTIDFDYHPEAGYPFAVTRHVDRDTDGTVRTDTIDTVTFVDGLGRVTQTKEDAAVHTGTDTPSADVMVVSGREVFDFLGRVVKQFYPVTEAKGAANTAFNATFDPVPPTTMAYDVLDRTTSMVLPDNTATTSSYGFGPDRAGRTQFETVVTDANGKVKRSYTDVRELTTALKEVNPAGGQPVIWTSFRHDALGQQTAIVDDRGNVTLSTYDNFGRRTSVTNPDSGRTETGYDLAGNVVKKITAKLAAEQKAIEYDYDFGRLRAVRYPVFPANNVTYTYGPPGAPNNSADRITTVVDGAGTETREYGPLGELTRETRTTPVQGGQTRTFATEYRYDTFGRVLRMTFPDGEALSYRYDSGGRVERATGAKGTFSYTYLQRLDYDKFGERVLLDTGNGTRTQYTYDTLDRRLTNMKANLSNGYAFQNLNYGYDDVGNVLSLWNDTQPPSGPEVGMQVGGPSTQTFRYDDLHRLVHAEGSYQSRNPGLDRYRADLAYDTVHNLTTKTQAHELVKNGNVRPDGKLSYTYNYAYASAKPHAPTTIGIYSLQYDANGNQVSREQQPKPRRQLIWDEEDRLACSHENVQSQTLPQTPASCDNAGGTPNSARYRYDADGTRVVKDGAQFHLYPNQHYSTRGNHEFKHVYIGGTKLLTKFVEPDHRIEDRKYYSHADHLGSTGFVTDDSGGLAEHLQYFPGGETWVSEHPSQPVPHQFTGKELDPETGLYYFGARYYDPRTQVWQSPDPALPDSAGGSTDLSAYLYAAANPLVFDDPDGRQVRRKSRPRDAEAAGDRIALPPPPADTYINWAAAAQQQAEYYGNWGRVFSGASPGSVAMGSLALAGTVSQTIPGFSPTPDDAVALLLGAGGLGLALAMSMARAQTQAIPRAVPQTRRQQPPLVYATYTKEGPHGLIYVGRTSGYGTPDQVVAARDKGHKHLNVMGFGPAKLDQWEVSTLPRNRRRLDVSYQRIRGREQMLIDYFGGTIPEARAAGRKTRTANWKRGVYPWNPLGRVYHYAAAVAYGEIHPYTGR